MSEVERAERDSIIANTKYYIRVLEAAEKNGLANSLKQNLWDLYRVKYEEDDGK